MTTNRSRNRKSAKAAGAKFERDVADHLRDNLSEFIDRRVRTGSKDTGDIGGVRTAGGSRVTLECKNERTVKLSAWWREAETERINAGDQHTAVVHKRHGVAAPGDQWVTMTLDQLIKLLKD